MVDTSDEWILERTGISERRIADFPTRNSDLAYAAACMALEQAGIQAEQLDLIIVATATPDMIFPSTACVVQDRLGASRAGAFDLAAGCTGFVYGLVTAERFLLSPDTNYVLVIGSELCSRVVDFEDRNTCVIFGDGAGAAVLGKGTDSYGILSSHLGAEGSGGKHLCMPGGGSEHPATIETVQQKMHYLKMNGNEIFRFAIRVVPEVGDILLDKAGLTSDEVNWFVPHQANIRIINSAIKRMNIPAQRALINVDKLGNTSAASIPLAFSMAVAEGKVKPGDLVLMIGFGAGLTYGGVLLRWGSDKDA